MSTLKPYRVEFTNYEGQDRTVYIMALDGGTAALYVQERLDGKHCSTQLLSWEQAIEIEKTQEFMTARFTFDSSIDY